MKGSVFMVKVCQYCGEEYYEVKNIPLYIPETIREIMRFQPRCSCLKIIEEEKEKKIEYERKRELIRKKVKKYRDISLIDAKFLKSRFENDRYGENYLKFSQRYAKRILDEETFNKGIIFVGKSGTGKTFASSCIANYLMENGKSVLVINFGLYLNKIKREWAEAENDILNSVKLCDLLIIDDFGSERNTEFAIEKAFLLIDTRYRSEKPMIITSNLNLFQLEEKFTAKIRSRIEEMCYLIKVNSKDKRKDANSMFFKYIA
jgi:DNA replication protein DnaC